MTYGLIGKKLSHSYSKIIHGFMGNAGYELREIQPEDLDAFMGEAAFTGINVTIPYKEAVLPYCVLDESVKKIGSVNTIFNSGGILRGYNTDYFGFSRMAELVGITFRNKKVVILGSGGTSKTALSVAQDCGARETVTVTRQAVPSEGLCSYENLSRHYDCDVLINTTPVGMYPGVGQAPVELSGFTNLSAVIDVIYNPLRTRLLLDARERGIPTANGLAMLTAQAVKAHEIFFPGEQVAIDTLISKTAAHFSNVVLIGMPGCGKSTIGKALALRLGKEFSDTDEIIEARTKRRIPDIITNDGEEAFRELEREVIAEVSMTTGQVIATGGGSVLRKDNRDALSQNGTVVFLERALDKLATQGRPLSVNLEELYRKRLPLYEAACDFKICVEDDLVENLRNMINMLTG
jgi:shikimate dehydrogenase